MLAHMAKHYYSLPSFRFVLLHGLPGTSLSGTEFEFPSKDGCNKVELVWEANKNKLELRHEIVLRRSIKCQIRVHENKIPWDLLLEYVCAPPTPSPL